MSWRRQLDASAQDGFTLVLMALLLTAMLTVVALVIDLGYVRGSARQDQSMADLAALSAGPELEDGEYILACREMVNYLNLNAKGMPAIDAVDMCADLLDAKCFEGKSAYAVARRSSGKYDVAIELPVRDEAGAYPAMGAGDEDGEECDRMRITVTSTDPAFFGGVAGATEYEATRSATIRAAPGDIDRVPALWLLEPRNCVALNVSGDGTLVEVGDMTPADPKDRIPGLIAVDSSGEGCSSSYTVTSSGKVRALNLTTEPKGEIKLHALPRGATTCQGRACNPADVSGSRLAPQPVPAPRRATRAPVDWKWNCKASYPNYLGVPIEGCRDTDERDAYIDALVDAIPSSGKPSDYTRWTDHYNCTVQGALEVPAGDWYIDCSTLRINNNRGVSFKGGNIVADGTITTAGNGMFRTNVDHPSAAGSESCLPPEGEVPCIDKSTAKASFLYLRDGGNIDVSSGAGTDGAPAFQLNHTAVYMEDGYVTAGGGAALRWLAPTEGPFAGLALWSENEQESINSYSLTGSGLMEMAGAFFTPYAWTLKLSGGATWNVKNAQFISQGIAVSGGAEMYLAPSSVDLIPLPPLEALLIR
jgi:hypothetical protein